MAGAIAGAPHGAQRIKSEWAQKAQQVSAVNQADLATELVRVAVAKCERQKAAGSVSASIVVA